MTDTVDALVLDLLEWIGREPRPYAEVIEAWRTSCPRLPVWEEANARGWVTQQHREGLGAFVCVSAQGREWLARHRPRSAWPVAVEQIPQGKVRERRPRYAAS